MGTNSFHIVVARLTGDDIRPIYRRGEKIQLGEKLEKGGDITPEAMARGWACLARFAERIQGIPRHRVQVVGTNALRLANNRKAFIQKAETILGGHHIEVISGQEEARLVFLGAADAIAAHDESRLVIDVGGGSTELIVGEKSRILQADSLQVGCVSFNRYFPSGEITPQNFQNALFAASLALYGTGPSFLKYGWEQVVGTSGTLRTIELVLMAHGWSQGGISVQGLKKLKEKILSYSHFDQLNLPGIKPERQYLFVSGLAVVSALFETLKIETMEVSAGALREGLLCDIAGRMHHTDIRDKAVQHMAARFSVNQDQADRVERIAMHCFAEVAEGWDLGERSRSLLFWACRLYEVGMTVSHQKHHHHGAYLILHSDLPGFSRKQKRLLSTIIRCHRRKIKQSIIGELAEKDRVATYRLIALLRVAIVLGQGREREDFEDALFSAADDSLNITFANGWLSAHPLAKARLEEEGNYLGPLGIKLTVV